jgi:uncharacterized membrane protein
MVILAVAGLGVAIYLTVIHYAGISPACSLGQSCIKVQTSQWSKLAGVPVALLGLLGYIAILAGLLAPDREQTRLAVLGLTVGGFGFSAYLTYRELFSIHAICEWCASSAVILTLLTAGAITRYLIGSSIADELFPGAGPPADGAAPEAELRNELARPRA